MKQNQKIVLMVVGFLATTGFWASVQALETEEKPVNPEIFRARMTEKKEELDAKRIENREMLEERKDEIQEKRAEIRERKRERFQKVAEKITTKINNIVIRLKEAGIDTSLIETYLIELAAKNTLVEEASASLDAALESENSAEIKEEQEDLKTAIQDLRNYYQNTLRPAIKSAIEEARS